MPPDDTTRIGPKFHHQVDWMSRMHCHIALDCPIDLVSIELVSSSARVTSVKFHTMSLTHLERTHIDWSDKKLHNFSASLKKPYRSIFQMCDQLADRWDFKASIAC